MNSCRRCDNYNFLRKTTTRETKSMAITPFSASDKNLTNHPLDSKQDALLQALGGIDKSELQEINAHVQATLYIEASLREMYRRQQQEKSAQRAQALNELIINSSPEDVFGLIQAICSEQ